MNPEPKSLHSLRTAFEKFVRDACSLIAGDKRLFLVVQRPWVKIQRSGGPDSTSFSLPTVSRPQPILTTPAEVRVAALDAANAALEHLQTHPARSELFPPPDLRMPDFEESAYLRKTYVVGFLKRYLRGASQPDYQPEAFDEAFADLTSILSDRLVEERVLIPLVGLTWSCEGDTIALTDRVHLRRLTDADREGMLNAAADPVLRFSREPDVPTLIWVQAAVDAGWRIPLHAPRLSQDRFEEAVDVITALRLSAPGMISAPGSFGSTPFSEWYTSGRLYSPLRLRAMTGLEGYSLTEKGSVSVREIFRGLRNLHSFDRKAVDLPIERFHRSFDVRRVEERVVDLIIALDSLLGSRGPASVQTLSMRLPLYVSDGGPARLRLSRLVREAYRLRSVIVHGGSVSPTPSHEFAQCSPATFLAELEDAVRRAIRRAILDAASGARRIAEVVGFIDEDLILGSQTAGDKDS